MNSSTVYPVYQVWTMKVLRRRIDFRVSERGRAGADACTAERFLWNLSRSKLVCGSYRMYSLTGYSNWRATWEYANMLGIAPDLTGGGLSSLYWWYESLPSTTSPMSLHTEFTRDPCSLRLCRGRPPWLAHSLSPAHTASPAIITLSSQAAG